MKLLKVDNKLIALHLASATTYTITDHIDEHNIKKITFTRSRFVILTSSQLYYLYRSQDGFKLYDLTDNIKRAVNVSDVKFVTSVHSEYWPSEIGIITTSGKVYVCTFSVNLYRKIECVGSLGNKNVVAISDNNLGYIYDNGRGGYVKGYLNNASQLEDICMPTSLPTNFIHPVRVVCDKKYIVDTGGVHKFKVIKDNVSVCYNADYYCGKDNLVHCFNDIGKINYDYHVTDYHTMVDYDDKHKIILVNKTGMIEYITALNGNRTLHPIVQSYYHVENLSQYSNNTWNIRWTINNHQLFGEYASKFVKNILICHKYGKLQRWIPKGVLYLILQFVL